MSNINMEDAVFEKFGKKFRGIRQPDNSYRFVEIRDAVQNPTEPSSSSGISVAPEPGKKRKVAEDDDDEDNCVQDHDMEEDGDEDDGDDEDDNDEDEDDDGSMADVKRDNLKPKKFRVCWNDAETKKFLEICQEKHVIEKIDGKIGQNLTRKQIFATVSKELKSAQLSKGEKTWAHCKEKYGKMKKTYKETMRKNNKSGEGRATCKFFEELHSLFHKRPVVTCHAHGYDRNMNVVSSAEEESSSTIEAPVADDTPPTKQQRPRYRSVSAKSVTNAMLLEQLFKREDEKDAADKQWLEKHTEKVSELDEQVLTRVTDKIVTSLNSGMERFAQMMVNAMMQQASSSSTNFNNVPSNRQPMQQASSSSTNFNNFTINPQPMQQASPSTSPNNLPSDPQPMQQPFHSPVQTIRPVSSNHGPVPSAPDRPAASSSGYKVVTIPAATLASLQKMGSVKILPQAKR